MAYSKTNWVDRLVQFAGRYAKSGETSTQVTLTADPGTVTNAGTPLNASNMNHIEQGIADAHTTADAALPKTGGTMTGEILFNFPNANLRGTSQYMFVGAKEGGYLCSNAYVDPADATWKRYDTSKPAMVIIPDKGAAAKVYKAPAGTGTITWTIVDIITTEGGQTVNGGLTATGNMTAPMFYARATSGTPAANGAYVFMEYDEANDRGYIQAGDSVSTKPLSLVGSIVGVQKAGGSFQEIWTTEKIRINNGALEFWNGTAWLPVGEPPMGRGRTASVSKSAWDGGGWNTVVNVSGYPGRIEYLVGTTSATTYEMRLTLDGVTETLAMGSFLPWTVSGGGTPVNEPILFYNSMLLEFRLTSAPEELFMNVTAGYRLKVGAP